MQLATSVNNQPWNCNVYYLVDDEINLYWASLPTRRHSREIAKNPKVAAAIVVNNQIGQPVIGVQVEGRVEIVNDADQIKPIALKYAERFKRTKEWVNDFTSSKTEHKLYRLRPSLFVLFDETNFKDQPRQEWRPE